MVGAYLSNKLCTKNTFDKTSGEYLTAGEKQIDKRNWGLIEMTMLKANINEPPKNAPKEFQLDYLEKLEQIKILERLDEN